MSKCGIPFYVRVHETIIIFYNFRPCHSNIESQHFALCAMLKHGFFCHRFKFLAVNINKAIRLEKILLYARNSLKTFMMK
jgi:hypothetical protein